MNKNRILVDAPQFKERMEELIPKAKNVVYVQAMTFEGDSVGEWLIDLLVKSKAKDVRLCVDSYSKLVINDHFIPSFKYLFDSSFRREVKQTNRLLEFAKKRGIKVTVTNPLGFLFLNYPFRNHKKIVVIDNTSFIGGINFSEHNFEWHDMMLEMHNSEISNLLQEDVKYTGQRINQNKKIDLNNSQLYLLDGWASRDTYSEIFANLGRAKKSIHIFSPYISDPLLSFIRRDIPSGVDLKIISPQQNNKSLFKSLLMNEVIKNYFSLWFFQNQMSHLKAILVDDEILIAGSSNFDFISYYFEQEVVLVTRNDEIVSDFIKKIKLPDMEQSIPMTINDVKKNHLAVLLYQIILNSCRLLGFIKNIMNSLTRNDKKM